MKSDTRALRSLAVLTVVLGCLVIPAVLFPLPAYGSEIVGWGDIKLPGTPLTNLTKIAAGWDHSLALKSDGSIVGWGSNDYGEATPPQGNNFIAIAGGHSFSLALKSHGSIVGWGSNDYGEATPPAGNNFIAISAGGGHGLALKSDGSIVGWGYNYYGQARPPAGNNFVAIAAGDGYSLALKSDSSIVAWGYNISGQATPPSGNNFVAIAAGENHSLALKSDGGIVGWGNNSYGQATPPAGNNFIAIAAGREYSLALKSDGSIVGWGSNDYGAATPPQGNNFVAIAACGGFTWAGAHSLALKSDGSIVGWGDNIFNQATPPAGNNFIAIAAGTWYSLALKSDGSIVGLGYDGYGEATPPAGNNFIAIAAGYSHFLALESDGSIVGWGYNDYGKATPPVGSNFVAIAAGMEHSLALKSDGSIVGWGQNNYGKATPPAGNNFVAIAAGMEHSLALKSDGSIVGWGQNNYGEATPPEGNDFVGIAASGDWLGHGYSLALKSDGSIVGWGSNDYGEATPPEGNDFVAIAASADWLGHGYSLALEGGESILAFKVKRVAPVHSGNMGPTILSVIGSGFKEGVSTRLIRQGYVDILPLQTSRISTCLIEAKFDFEGIATGKYDVVVQNPGSQAVTLKDGFEAIQGGQPQLWTKMRVPPQIRSGRKYTVWVDYGNEGSASMPVRLFRVSSPSGAPMLLQLATFGSSSSVQFLGISFAGDAGVLYPGMSHSIPVYFQGIPADIQFQLEEVTDYDSSIDWGVIEHQIRPQGADPNTWDAIFTKLRAGVGSTWGDYVTALIGYANRLAAAGHRVYDTTSLFAMAVREASGLPTGMVTGRIVTGPNDSPLRNVTVTLFNDQEIRGGTALTATDGAFFINSVAPGAHTVMVDGYLVQDTNVIQVVQDSLDNIIRVKPAAKIIGTVLGPSSIPIEGASVTLTGPSPKPFAAISDATGHFYISSIPDGDWQLSAYADGYVSAQPVSVTIQGSGTIVQEVLMTYGASVSGLVTNMQGVPLNGAVVSVSSSGGPGAAATTGSDGRYTVNGIWPGDCDVIASANGYVPAAQTLTNVDASQVIENLDFSLASGLAVMGWVTNSQSGLPVENALLSFVATYPQFGVAETDPNGFFTCTECAAQEYTIYYAAEGYESAQYTIAVPPEGLAEPLHLTLMPSEDSQFLSRAARFRDLKTELSSNGCSDDDPVEYAYRFWIELILRTKGVDHCKRKGWPVAARHLNYFLGPTGCNPVKQQGLVYPYPAGSGLSNLAKQAPCADPFSRVKQTTETSLKQELDNRQGQIAIGQPYGLGANPLCFYYSGPNAGFPAYQQTYGDLIYGFGTMSEGSYEVVSVTPLQEETEKVQVAVRYRFMDYYQWTDYHRKFIWEPWNTWALDLQIAGWATTFWTSIEIVDEFEHTIHKPDQPDPPTDPVDSGTSRVIRPIDPSEKLGTIGYDPCGTPDELRRHFVHPGDPLMYTVFFENEPNATGPAQEVRVVDYLSPSLNWATIELGEIVFGDQVMTTLAGKVSGQFSVPLADSNYIVDVSAQFNVYTGRMSWVLRTIDPNTGELPEDPLAGFLPPNDANHCGEGHVSFTIYPQEGLLDAHITNKATIFFDTETPLDVNFWSNSVDGLPPVSAMSPLPALTTPTRFEVCWSGDDGQGCGIAGYDIYVATNDEPNVPWILNTCETSAVFVGAPGYMYRFHSIAHDFMGNIESAPAVPDAETTLRPIDFHFYAMFADRWLENGCHSPLWCDGMDFDQNGNVGLTDLAEIAEHWLEGI